MVLWLVTARTAARSTELKAIKELKPRLKPIVIVNKLDEIDEEEEKPENIIANAAKLFKDKVTKVIGVSTSAPWMENCKGNRSYCKQVTLTR